jgi:hypothetical protein
MPATTLPNNSFDKAKTVVGRQSVIGITIAASEKVYLVDFVGDGGAIDVARMQAPGAGNGLSFTARTWSKSRTELWKFRTKEIKRVIADFGSLTFHKAGTVTLFIRDPDDAANKVALLSETGFVASIYRDPTEIAHSGDNPSEITIVIESHKDGAVTFTADGDTQAPA